MNKYKKILLLLFISLLLLSSLFGCSNDDSSEETTAEIVDTEPDQYLDDLPNNLDFGGKEITFVIGDYVTNSGREAFSARSIGLEDFTPGDVGASIVDEEVYYRNIEVEDRLNVLITPRAYTTNLSATVVGVELLSGGSEIDVICGYQCFDITMLTEGLLLDYNHLSEQNADYIDINKDYWGKEYIDAITYKDAMYWITGDLSLRYLGGMHCTYVNLELYENALKDTYGDIYTLVKNKGWNLDVMNQMITQAFQDVGTKEDVADESDVLGFVTEYVEMDGMSVASGVSFVVKKEDGSLSVALSDSTLNNNAFEFTNKMYEILHENKGTLLRTVNIGKNIPLNMFASGNVLFVQSMVFNAEAFLSDMETYGILPCPMLNADQEEYRTALQDACTLFGIYVGSDSVAASVATLEAMASQGYETVAPAYYDETLKYRYSRDPESAEMIDLMRDSVYVDFGYAWGRSFNNIHNFFRTAVQSPAKMSTFRKDSSIWEGNLTSLIGKLEAQLNGISG
ncbi:MAG: hypothetical protein IJW55_01395 [Clostridia bacterium]|nr:hypothetical protein [Clostridia bacterium]